jgi:hypothetical protein
LNDNRKDLLRKSIVRVKKRPNYYDPSEFSLSKQRAIEFTKKQYFGNNKKLIEDFFVIGMDHDDIPKFKKGQNPSIINMKSKVLYMHTDQKECQRRSVIKDFCFPNDSSQ